jgi:hypothetical protein
VKRKADRLGQQPTLNTSRTSFAPSSTGLVADRDEPLEGFEEAAAISQEILQLG